MAGESLRVVSGPAAGQVLPIGGDFTVGRAESGPGGLQGDSDISRRHARFHEYAPGMVAVEDLGSTNGTYVNGQRLAGPHVLQPGDQVQVGQTVLRYESVPASSPVPVAAAPAPAPAAPAPAPPPAAFALGTGPQPGPAPPLPRRGGSGRMIALIGIPVLIVAGVVIAIVASSGGGSGGSGGGGSPAAATPTGVIMAFYDDAAAGKTADACALFAPNADQRVAPANLLVAGTGTILATTPACATTLDALHNANPSALQTALPKIREKATGTTATRSNVIISRTDSGLTYKATVVKSGSDWKIADVVVG
jgi:FHA domain